MKLTIIETIKHTLNLKSKCTLQDIVKGTGIKYPEVLVSISRNKHLLHLNKNGVITGFVDVKHKQLQYQFKCGSTYIPVKETQTLPKHILVKETEATNKLKEQYVYGIYGDVTTVIYDTKENREALEANDFVNQNTLRTYTIEELWDSPNMCLNYGVITSAEYPKY